MNDLTLLRERLLQAEPLEGAFAARSLAAEGDTAFVSGYHAAMAAKADPTDWQTAAWLWAAGEDLDLLEAEAREATLTAARHLFPALLAQQLTSTVAYGARYGALRVLAPLLPELELSRPLKDTREFVIAHATWEGRLSGRPGTNELDPALLLLLPFGMFDAENLLMVATVRALEDRGVTGGAATAWLAWYYQVKGTHPGRLAELRAALAGDSPWEATFRLLMAHQNGQSVVIRHIPTGYDHPYHRYVPERIPRDPLVGQSVEIRATAVGTRGPLRLEWRLNSVDQVPIKAGFQPPVSAEEGYWSATVGPFAAGARVEYRWLTPETVTDWYRFGVLAPNSIRRTVGAIQLEDGGLTLVCDDDLGLRSASLNLTVDGEENLHIRFEPGVAPALGAPLQSPGGEWQVGPYRVEVSAEPFGLQVVDAAGRRLLTDHKEQAWTWLENPDGQVTRLSKAVTLKPDERLYGTGERFDRLDRRGTVVLNTVYNQYKRQGDRTYLPVPFVLSSEGYGLWAATSRVGEIDLGATVVDRLSFTFSGAALELVLIPGPGLPDLIHRFTSLTGRPVLPPPWTFGPWVSSNNWNSQAEVERQLQLAAEHDIPTSVVVLEQWSDEATYYLFNDAQYEPRPGSEPFRYEDFLFPAWGRWPDPRAMVRDLKRQGIRLLLWQIPIWKYMNGLRHDQHDRDEAWLIEQGYVIKNPDGSPYRAPEGWFAGSLLVDFTNPDAVAWWLEKRRYLLDEVGIDGFKTDGGEFIWNREAVMADGTTGDAGRNLYPNQFIGATYRFVQERTGGNGVCFSRAGYTGAQAYPLHWAGDQASTWPEFRSALIAGLNAGLSGIPFWGWDLGGFSEEMPTPELFCRGAAMACFCPIMQYHTDQHREDRTPWNIAERSGRDEVIHIYRRLVHLRYNLVPYIYSQAVEAARTGLPLMRPLVLIHPDDPIAAGITDQYYFGTDLLVAPVVEPGVSGRNVSLPDGDWYDFWTGSLVHGGQSLWCEAPWDRIPVFVRAGAVIPLNLADSGRLCEGMRHGDAEGLRNLHLLVYPSKGALEATLEPVTGERISVRGQAVGQRIQLSLAGVKREVTVAARPAALDLPAGRLRRTRHDEHFEL